MTDKMNISGFEEDLTKEVNKSEDYFKPLNNKKIAISVSINEDLEKLGLSEQHLNDISIEIARYIIANGGVAIYGGDLRINGFTNYFAELANQYKKTDDTSLGFINYFALPNSRYIDKKTRIDYASKNIGIEIVNPRDGIYFNSEGNYNPNQNIQDRYIFSECFKAMREKMAEDSHARIIVGGKHQNYLGFIPGIIEEAIYTLGMKKPLYIVGGFGGCSKSLAKIFEGKIPKELTNEYQYSTSFLQEFEKKIKMKFEFSDYSQIIDYLKNFSIHDLSSLNNLTVEENKILFRSQNIHEITYLLMKGLKKI